jgi:predicted metal-dependent hydrolase
MKQTDRAQTLTIAGISVELTQKNIKHAYLRVKRPAGAVTLSAPRTMPDDAIERFVREKAGWIQKQLEKPVPLTRAEERSFISGETLAVWGRAYPLELRLGTRYAIVLDGDAAVLTAPRNGTPARREAFARQWVRELLKAEAARMLQQWEAATGLKAAGFRTKDMKTRWGSCNIKTRLLWFNLQLVKLPPACLDYVVLHELLHLAERSHGKRFYALLSSYMPGWKSVKAELSGRRPRVGIDRAV